MQYDANPIAELFSRESRDPSVAVVDGYGVGLHVHHGYLVIDDGIGQHRRQRRYSRAERRLKRIVISGDTGTITLDAIRWCADMGITITQIDREARQLMAAGAPGADDARIRRAQAASLTSPLGLQIVRWLLTEKISGHADIAEGYLALPVAANNLHHHAKSLGDAPDITACRDIEATAANLYFGLWVDRVFPQLATRDLDRIPKHWLGFDARRSPGLSGHSPRNAVTPINALLNYGYAIAQSECRTALLQVGLDPGLGIVHADVKNRDSLALDLLETVRPAVERHILDLLAGHVFRARDFTETRQGQCRLAPTITGDLSVDITLITRQVVAPTAEDLAHHIASGSPNRVRARTPLTQRNVRAAQSPGPRARQRVSTAASITPTCRDCGDVLLNQQRKLCSRCWSVERKQLATKRASAGLQRLAELRASGNDPSNTAEVRAQRAVSLSSRKREQLTYDKTHDTAQPWDPSIITALSDVPLSAIGAATGLSISACSRIRSGKLIPHRRHWNTLVGLAASPSTTEGFR
jgi:CRISPR-associated protein Cas1